MPSPNTALGFTVPRDIADWVRIVKARPTVNAMVEEIHKRLIVNETYVRLLDATVHEQSVEGSIVVDDTIAAQMIRAEAVLIDSPLKNEKISTIIKSLRQVLKWYGLSRYQRRTGFIHPDARQRSDHGGNGDEPESENGEQDGIL